ncbi:MAG: PD-(D/E)XK nuclease family protein, partial [Tissierellales bacterium]|nr:PD-(D/E)XK nuclease family protein [Tissierellales bacterium]
SPYHGAMYAVISSIAKIVALGGNYKKVRLSLQEYFEKLDFDYEKWGKPLSALLGAYDVQKNLKIAAIGGKDSMSGTFKDLNVPPTLISFAVCVGNIENIVSPEFKKADSTVVKISINKNQDETPDYNDIKMKYDKIHELIKSNEVLASNKITKDENIENLDKIYKEGLKWFLINYDNFENYLEEGFLYTNNKEYIEEDYIDKLYDNPLNLSPYRLESFAQCPFKFFVEYGLAPEERREYEVDSRDIGKIYHRSMEKFTKEIINNKEEFLELDKGIQIMEKSLDEALEEEKVNSSPIDYNYRNKYIKKKIKRVGIETAKGIVEQLNRSDFKPKYQEISFSEESALKPIEMILKDNRILKINGRIDRVDILNFNNNNYVNIIDYKSKDQSIDITALANGMELQLFIYLNALIDNSEEITGKPSDIGGVFYFSILLPWIDGDKHKDKDSIEKELLKEYKMEGYFLEDKELIKKLDKKIEEERESTVAKIKINKNGSISKSSQTLTREAYKGLLKYVNDKVLEIGKEIISGKILIEPFKRNQNIPCKSCSYIDICQFDKTMPDNKYKIIKKVDKKDFENILEKIGEEHDKLD